MSVTLDVRIRAAVAADSATIAAHRAEMFADMGLLPRASHAELVRMTSEYLGRAIPSGEYVGWLAVLGTEPERILGGAGVQLRRVLPFPDQGPAGPAIAEGREGIVLNVYTDRVWRRCGVARLLMESVVAWARANRLDRLVLHASAEGRVLYQQLGFEGTNEMQLGGSHRSRDDASA